MPSSVLSSEELSLLLSDVQHNACLPRGFDVAPFKPEWYNGAVSNSKFKLAVPEDSLAFVIVSLPSMFERSFLPYVRDNWTRLCDRTDTLDQCMKHVFSLLAAYVTSKCPDEDVLCMHDFELAPNRRPKVLVQTAGHVSGIVRLYQESDADASQLEVKGDKVYPVCLHPQYGGWFALRGVIVLPNVKASMSRPEPPQVLNSPQQVAQVLNLYNDHWRDNRFRDWAADGIVKERYSDLQRKYFALKAGPERKRLLATALSIKNYQETETKKRSEVCNSIT